jgi:hypothetical protein
VNATTGGPGSSPTMVVQMPNEAGAPSSEESSDSGGDESESVIEYSNQYQLLLYFY